MEHCHFEVLSSQDVPLRLSPDTVGCVARCNLHEAALWGRHDPPVGVRVE